MTVIFLISILLLTFFLRAYPRIILPHSVTGDSYFHLYLIRLIIKNKRRSPREDKRYVLNSECNYPYFYHWLMALLGEKRMFFTERYSSSFFDTVNCFLMYLLAQCVFVQHDLSDNYALIVSLLYAVQPILFKTGDEPRIHNGSSRVFVQALFLAHMIGAYWYLNFHSLTGLSLSVISATFIFFTAAFGFQVLLFFTPVIAVFFPFYLFITVLSLLLSIVVTRGRSWELIAAKYSHLIYLYKSKMYYQRLSLWTDVKVFIKSCFGLAKLLFTFQIGSFFRKSYLNHSPIMRNLLGFHMFIILLNVEYYSRFKFLYVWMLTAFLLFLITKLPGLRIIGKAERYLEYAVYPSLILCVLFLSQFSFAVWLIFPYLVFCLIGIYVYNKEYIDGHKIENNDFEATKELFENFNSQNKEGIIWTLHPFLYKPMFFTKFPILGYYAGTINYEKVPKREIEDMLGNYPYPSFDFFKVLSRYEVSYIITAKSYLNHYLKKAGATEKELEEKGLTKIGETALIVIYSTRK